MVKLCGTMKRSILVLANLSFLLLPCLTRAQLTFFKARTDIEAINGALPLIKKEVVPTVVGLINEGIAEETIKAPEYSIEDPAKLFKLSLRAQIGQIRLQPDDNNVYLTVHRSLTSQRAVEVRLTLTDLAASIRRPEFSLRAQIKTIFGTISLPSCSFRMVAGGKLAKLELVFEVQITESNVLAFKTKAINLGKFDVKLAPSLKYTGICDLFLGSLLNPLLNMVEDAANFLIANLGYHCFS